MVEYAANMAQSIVVTYNDDSIDMTNCVGYSVA